MLYLILNESRYTTIDSQSASKKCEGMLSRAFGFGDTREIKIHVYGKRQTSDSS